MAKLKLKELALELGIENDDAKKILTDNGRESNYSRLTIASVLEEEDIELIRKEASSYKKKGDDAAKEDKKPEKSSEEKKSTPKKAEAAGDEAAKKNSQDGGDKAAKEAKTADAPQANAQPQSARAKAVQPPKPAVRPEQKNDASGNAPKKKKAIIFVNNSAGAKPQQRDRMQGGSRPPVRGGNQPHQIIKPTIKPGAITQTPRPAQPQVPTRKKTAPEQAETQQTQASTQPAAAPERSENTPRQNQANVTIQTLQPKGDVNERKEDRQSKGDQSRTANSGRTFSSPDRPSRSDGGSQGRPGKDKDSKKHGQGNGQENQKGGKNRLKSDSSRKSRRDQIYEDDAEVRGNRNKPGRFIKPEKKEEPEEEKIKVITIPETITIKDLADKMKVQPSAIIKKLFMQGQIVTVNQEVDFETAENIAIEYEIICEKEEVVDVIEELLKEADEDEKDMVSRPPVICVMGHVDHGKTSLLDAIRKTNVTDKEAGGITQHIGAYRVKINDQSITFLDTPGHEAFTAMRMRGANSTDIAILVVAADDGVMPQTVEAINHAKAAGIEIIVAVNKIDKPGANIDRVKQELTEYELIPTDWGGSTEFVPVSAKSGEGIDTLLETIILTAEILELKANPNRMGRGLVIEAELDKGRGPVATVLVQKGTLHVGDFISAGSSHGRVRAMVDDKGRRVREAKPSTPVEILGLSDVPGAGEIFIAHESDKEAKQFADTFEAQNKVKKLEETKSKMSLDDLFSQIQAGNLKELNLIVKADVQGSVEAVKQSLMKLSNDEVVVKCIHGGVGAINESDVVLASASSAIIIGFNVRPDAMAKATAEREGVDVRLYKVIYQAIEDVEAAMKGMLDPVFEEQVIGHAEVRQIFKASAVGNIAGSYVLDGRFERDCKIRISREGEQIYEGSLASLKRFKDDVKEVKAGFECGLVFDGFDQMQELDIVEAYIMVEVPR